MAKPKDTKTTKWKLIASSPNHYLTRANAVEWGKSYKLPYTVEKKPPLPNSSYPNSWQLRVYQPTLWKGRKVEGSANYGIPFKTKKHAMMSFRYGKYELVQIRGGAWIFVEKGIVYPPSTQWFPAPTKQSKRRMRLYHRVSNQKTQGANKDTPFKTKAQAQARAERLRKMFKWDKPSTYIRVIQNKSGWWVYMANTGSQTRSG